MSPQSRRIYDLFILNLALQVFDAVATYKGLELGWKEGNPILVRAFDFFGVLPALLLFKAKACGLLFLLNRHREHRLVAPAMTLLAGVYCVMSLVPWLVKYIGLLAQSL